MNALASLLFAARIAYAADLPPEAREDARRLGAILDYVAVDYGGAVSAGQVSNADEYAEQVGFLQDATELARRLPTADVDVAAEVAGLRAKVEALAPAEDVAAEAQRVRRDVLGAYGVVLAPSSTPSRASGARLYVESCAACHGATGVADTPTAATLTPPPRNFRDPAVMEELTPARAFNGVTDGVKGTAMPAFAQLTSSQRWDLAFYVFTLRHDPAAEARGRALAEAGTIPLRGVSELAASSDASLHVNVRPEQATDAVAWYRGVAAYQDGRPPLSAARSGLDDALRALHDGDRVDARRLAGEAYLAGFEPHEATLRAASPDLVARVEEAFLSVRARIDGGATLDEVESEVLRTQALLDDAEATLAGAHGANVAFVGALLVVLREGLEAALLLLLLLGLASREGPAARRQVHAGWIVAVAVGVATWFASDALVGVAGSRRELIEGSVTLLAAFVMVTAHHWLRGAKDGKRRVDDIREVLGREVGRWTLFVLAFGAVYREAFEVVLFLQAIALDGGSGTAPVLAGVGAGGVLLVGLVAALLRLGRRVKPGPVLTGASILLCAMAVVFAGKGLRALQEAGVVSIHALGGVRVDGLGIFPTVETVFAQVVLSLGLLGSALWPRRDVPSGPTASTDGRAVAK